MLCLCMKEILFTLLFVNSMLHFGSNTHHPVPADFCSTNILNGWLIASNFLHFIVLHTMKQRELMVFIFK